MGGCALYNLLTDGMTLAGSFHAGLPFVWDVLESQRPFESSRICHAIIPFSRTGKVTIKEAHCNV